MLRGLRQPFPSATYAIPPSIFSSSSTLDFGPDFQSRQTSNSVNDQTHLASSHRLDSVRCVKLSMAMKPLSIGENGRRWDCVSLGEVMLRMDPGEGRIHTTRQFQAWEGGGEYNVARGLRRCFGLRTAIATALAENPVGRLVEDLMLQGGVDQDLVRWVPFDGVGRKVRNGLNFTERGYGVRAG